MPRIAGVDLPKTKPMAIALTYIFGIGKYTAEKILKEAEIDLTVRAYDDEITGEYILVERYEQLEEKLKEAELIIANIQEDYMAMLVDRDHSVINDFLKSIEQEIKP